MRPRFAILGPLSTRDFRLLGIGQATSMLGDGAFYVALAWQVYDISPHPTALSVVLAARAIPMLLLLLVGGAVTDRFPRRLVMLASDGIRGTTVALLAVLAGTGLLQLWHLILLGAVFGAADAFFYPAFASILPEILESDLLLQANALEAVVRPLAIRLAGPALGGLLVARVGTAGAFWLDAVTFGVSVAALLAMQARSVPGGGRPGIFDEVREGYRYARAEAWIWVTLVVAAFSVLFAVGPFDVLMPLLVRERLRAGADAYGMIIAASGAGGIFAALAVGHLGNPRRRITAMFLAWGIGSIAFGAMALPRHLIWAVLVAALTGIAFEYGGVLWSTMLQEWVPGRLLGRVRSLDYLVSFGLMPVSYALTGPVAGIVGHALTLVVGGTLSGAVWFIGLFWPHVRDRERAGEMSAGDRS